MTLAYGSYAFFSVLSNNEMIHKVDYWTTNLFIREIQDMKDILL